MSLLYTVLFATRCRSNHHRLALDALRWLKHPEALGWRDLFLHYHDSYLEGAKAPDERFKDFKNHVLHVKDNYWGGAIGAAEEWKKRTARALAARDWKLAVYSAGVLSHYVVDPIQPFHTGQTEEENVIHRAVEQSFSKAYEDFQELLEELGGYPDFALPTGEDWLANTVRQGAEAANKHYDTIIDHYDFAKGARKPLEGLDETLEHAIAPLVGRAAVTLARIYDRLFEEAAVSPPRVSNTLEAVFATLNAPIRAVANKIADDKERALVLAMYAEFQQTGKVRKTLPEDDRQVRALYAAEVANRPLSDLDSQWPRELGAAHGVSPEDEAEAKHAKPKPAPVAKEAKPAVQAEPAPAQTHMQTPAISSSPFAALLTPPPAPAPEPPPQTEAQPSAAIIRLHADDPVVDAPSIGAKTAARLEAAGVRTVGDLLKAAPEDAARALKASHITPPVIRDWQAQALLACAVPNLRSVDALALVACGVRDVAALAKQDAGRLGEMLAAWLRTSEGKNLSRNAKAPGGDAINAWIKAARGAAQQAA